MKPLDGRQRDILEYLHDNQSFSLTLTDIGDAVGIDHPQKVLDKIDQLIRMGYITKSPFWGYQVLKRFEETDQLMIPFFGFAQCWNAGKSILAEYPRKKLEVAKKLIVSSEKESYFITRAKGDSMEPFIHSGDFLLIKVQSGFNPEDKVMVVHNWLPKIKKVLQDGDKLVLRSFNPAFGDFVVDEDDTAEIVGVVKERFSKDTFVV
jgi:SOS-response transcriptional repressor LexA